MVVNVCDNIHQALYVLALKARTIDERADVLDEDDSERVIDEQQGDNAYRMSLPGVSEDSGQALMHAGQKHPQS